MEDAGRPEAHGDPPAAAGDRAPEAAPAKWRPGDPWTSEIRAKHEAAQQAKGQKDAGARSASVQVRRASPKPRPERTAVAKAQRERELEAERSARALLAPIDGAVRLTFGEECTSEAAGLRDEILDPAQRMMLRASPEVVELISKWSDPILLTTAVAAWISHIWRVAVAPKGDEGPGPGDEPPEPTPPRRDNGGHEKRVETGPDQPRRVLTAEEISALVEDVP